MGIRLFAIGFVFSLLGTSIVCGETTYETSDCFPEIKEEEEEFLHGYEFSVGKGWIQVVHNGMVVNCAGFAVSGVDYPLDDLITIHERAILPPIPATCICRVAQTTKIDGLWAEEFLVEVYMEDSADPLARQYMPIPGFGYYPAHPLATQCKEQGLPGSVDPENYPWEETIYLEGWPNGIHLFHENQTYQCGVTEAFVSAEVDGSTVRFYEQPAFTGLADCYCPYDLKGISDSLDPGIYEVEVYTYSDEDVFAPPALEHTETVVVPAVTWGYEESSQLDEGEAPDPNNPGGTTTVKTFPGGVEFLHQGARFPCRMTVLQQEARIRGTEIHLFELPDPPDGLGGDCTRTYNLFQRIAGLPGGNYKVILHIGGEDSIDMYRPVTIDAAPSDSLSVF